MVRVCLPILASFPVHSRWVENLALTVLPPPLIYPRRPCRPWKRHSRERQVPILRVHFRTIIQAHPFRHFMSPRLTTTGCIITLLHLAAAISGMVAQGTIMLSTRTPPGPKPAHYHTRHMSIRLLAWILLGMAVPRMSGILIFQLHRQPLHSPPRDCRFGGLITFEIIMRTDTRQVTKIPSGRHLMLARLELTRNFRLPLVTHPQTFTMGNNLHRDLTREHIPPSPDLDAFSALYCLNTVCVPLLSSFFFLFLL